MTQGFQKSLHFKCSVKKETAFKLLVFDTILLIVFQTLMIDFVKKLKNLDT